jgi:hypothetical protein
MDARAARVARDRLRLLLDLALAQAVFDRGGMGDSIGGLGRRAIQLGQSVQYALLTVSAVRILLGARGGRGPKRAAAGILGWPGGTVIVAALGVAVAIVAVVNVYWGVSKRSWNRSIDAS